MTTKEWIMSASLRREIEREKDIAFRWGYVLGCGLTTVIVLGLQHWGLW